MSRRHFQVPFDYLVTGTCLLFWFLAAEVSVVIITILRALVLSADVTPENNFYTRFYIDISSFETLKS